MSSVKESGGSFWSCFPCCSTPTCCSTKRADEESVIPQGQTLTTVHVKPRIPFPIIVPIEKFLTEGKVSYLKLEFQRDVFMGPVGAEIKVIREKVFKNMIEVLKGSIFNAPTDMTFLCQLDLCIVAVTRNTLQHSFLSREQILGNNLSMFLTEKIKMDVCHEGSFVNSKAHLHLGVDRSYTFRAVEIFLEKSIELSGEKEVFIANISIILLKNIYLLVQFQFLKTDSDGRLSGPSRSTPSSSSSAKNTLQELPNGSSTHSMSPSQPQSPVPSFQDDNSARNSLESSARPTLEITSCSSPGSSPGPLPSPVGRKLGQLAAKHRRNPVVFTGLDGDKSYPFNAILGQLKDINTPVHRATAKVHPSAVQRSPRLPLPTMAVLDLAAMGVEEDDDLGLELRDL